MDAKLFINYRREDTAPYAGRLYDRLTAHFGGDHVFMDIDQIEPGEDFVEVINRKVGTCDIAIVAIGPRWLSSTDASGKRRLDDEEDFVRMEIAAALQRKIRVIPVLVGGAQMPRKQDLPEELAPLSRRNAIELSETRFHADVNRLIEAIEKSFVIAEKKTELSATPVAPPAEPPSVRPQESKDRTTPVKSTQTTPAIPPVASMSAIAALREPTVWRRKRLIIVTAIGAMLVLAGVGYYFLKSHRAIVTGGQPAPSAAPSTSPEIVAASVSPQQELSPASVSAGTPTPPPAQSVAEASPSPAFSAAAKSESVTQPPDEHLTQYTNATYGFSALIPMDLVSKRPDSNDDDTVFLSPDGKTTVQLRVAGLSPNQKLRDMYQGCVVGRGIGEDHPNIGYKILKNNWFVVSGAKDGRGFYVKCVGRGQKLLLMILKYDEQTCPISEETMTTMSRSFTGRIEVGPTPRTR
jgi:TIR domain